MRAALHKIEIGEYEFCPELDTGSGEGEEIVCWVYKGGTPLRSKADSTLQYRRYFPLNASPQHLWNFARKFAANAEYRESLLMQAI